MTNKELKIIENESKNKIILINCVKCNQPTRHLIKVSLDKLGSYLDSDEDWNIEWSDRYQVVECQGCETVSFRHESWCSEAQDYHDDGITEEIYPPRDKDTISTKRYRNLPPNLRHIYKEIIDCFNNYSLILCAAGLRALVEGICAQQGIKDGPVEIPVKGGGKEIRRKDDLVGLISGIQEKGFLTQQTAQTLHQHRYLGNSAVHELVRPATDELKLAIEIVEHVLEQLYELPEKSAELQRAMARRKT